MEPVTAFLLAVVVIEEYSRNFEKIYAAVTPRGNDSTQGEEQKQDGEK